MKILITGNMGYVGSAVIRQLRKTYPGATLIGYDAAYFAHCLTDVELVPEQALDEQKFGDVRSLHEELLAGCDAVVHLAAVSNDPMGSRFAEVTHDVNQRASLNIANAASAAGVKNFVFASSCSVYGAATGDSRQETDAVNPVTAYAKSKVGTEKGLAALDGSMTVTCLRFATACGMSRRLRLDLVLNDFVACALSSRKITVLSDGTPWRPLIDTSDMALAISWAATRSAGNGGRYLVVNVGTNSANYQVRDLAEAVAQLVPGTQVSINTSAAVDSRSYKVDFSRYAELAPNHQPRSALNDSIAKLVVGLRNMGFADLDFRQSKMIRLKVLEGHISAGRLTDALRWQEERV